MGGVVERQSLELKLHQAQQALVEIKATLLRENTEGGLDQSIVRYFQHLGPGETLRRLQLMDIREVKTLIAHIKAGTLDKVLQAMEQESPHSILRTFEGEGGAMAAIASFDSEERKGAMKALRDEEVRRSLIKRQVSREDPRMQDLAKIIYGDDPNFSRIMKDLMGHDLKF